MAKTKKSKDAEIVLEKTQDKTAVGIADIRIAVFEFTGISPLLMDKLPPTLNQKQDKTATPEEIAAAKAYRHANGVLYAPSIWFRCSLIGGATGRKIAGFKTQGAPSVLKANVLSIIGEDHADLLEPKTGKTITDYKINSRFGRNKEYVPIELHQPEIPAWTCRVPFEIDVTMLSPKIVESFFVLAGRVCGVGAWRPKCSNGGSGPYGRYSAKLISVS